MFKEGDKLVEIYEDGRRMSDSVWTFDYYTESGRIKLREFKEEKCTFPKEYFRKLTPLEELL